MLPHGFSQDPANRMERGEAGDYLNQYEKYPALASPTTCDGSTLAPSSPPISAGEQSAGWKGKLLQIIDIYIFSLLTTAATTAAALQNWRDQFRPRVAPALSQFTPRPQKPVKIRQRL